jgi:glucose/arabinose dehydrogenase
MDYQDLAADYVRYIYQKGASKMKYIMSSFNHNKFKLEIVSEGLSFPTSITFDNNGMIYVVESGVPFDGQLPFGRILCIPHNDKHHRSVLLDGLKGPVNGIAFHNDRFYVSEGGLKGGICTVDKEGEKTVIINDLPGPGNYHTNMVAIGPDNKIYFSQGAMTNTAIVGLDAYELGWLRRLPHAHDIPGYKAILTGVNIETSNPFGNKEDSLTKTGAFMPFGVQTKSGQNISHGVPCTASIMRSNLDGSDLELVAWGLRNAYGLGFLPDGRLLATEQGPDDRGSRPVGNAPDLFFEIKEDCWYGWPDFVGGDPITDKRYAPTRGNKPSFLLSNHSQLPKPEEPLLRFPPNSCAAKFDVIPESVAEWGGLIVVALFGDEKPMTAPAGAHVGRTVAYIDPSDWRLCPFIDGPFFRPIDVRFNPVDQSLYIVDFGKFDMNDSLEVVAQQNTGRVLRVTASKDLKKKEDKNSCFTNSF